mmetsp:Transcript_100667/g.204096  ORF Transcript_100667/g.204096 Transcript_100667/m.204096 type:complete len:159 (+) Transcript_100667:68-544(+)
MVRCVALLWVRRGCWHIVRLGRALGALVWACAFVQDGGWVGHTECLGTVDGNSGWLACYHTRSVVFLPPPMPPLLARGTTTAAAADAAAAAAVDERLPTETGCGCRSSPAKGGSGGGSGAAAVVVCSPGCWDVMPALIDSETIDAALVKSNRYSRGML